MDFASIIRAIAIAIQARQPCLLVGIPGDAKTCITESLFRRLCEEHHTSIAALHEPPEYGGYPQPVAAHLDGAGTHVPAGVALLPCQWVNRLATVEKGLAGLFLDELSNAPPATRSAAMRGILDGTWGEVNIPRLTTIAAMNPAEIAESGYELSAPLANRFCHIDWDMPVAYWAEQLIAGFPEPAIPTLPANWERHLTAAKARLAAFASVRPAAIKQMPKEAAARGKAWASFRTHTMAMHLIAACESVGDDLEADTTLTLVSGCIGTGAALEYLTYAKEIDLPDPEEVLKNPASLVLPERGDRAYAVLTAVVSAVLADNTVDRWNRGWEVLAKAVEQERPDVAAGSARALARQRPKKGRVEPPPQVGAFVPLLKAAGLMDGS